MTKKVANNRLVSKYKGNTTDTDFSEFDALSLINKIKDGKLGLNYAKSDQARLKSNCKE